MRKHTVKENRQTQKESKKIQTRRIWETQTKKTGRSRQREVKQRFSSIPVTHFWATVIIQINIIYQNSQ